MTTHLREGFTTGTAAAAAAKAGVLALVGGWRGAVMDTPTPRAGRLSIPIAALEPEGDAIRVSVTKDGGDDPDATHGATICALVRLLPDGPRGEVRLEGGTGVGRVTLPGLPIPPGQAAINPAPRQQIADAVREAMDETNFCGAVDVTIEVPGGEAIAAHTMNGRLGIVGGISILGTRGTVRPYSHESYEASINQALSVARAAGHHTIALSTGGRTERLLLTDRPEIPRIASVQIADFFASSLRGARQYGMTRVVIGCFFGKLVKMAQGYEYTHAKDNRIDFDLLAKWCRQAGAQPGHARDIAGANTARHALEILVNDAHKNAIVTAIAHRALRAALSLAGPGIRIDYHVYDFDSTRLCHVTSEDAS
ncbi:cobalt-precorrin-5B (C(1))-methyltransferase [Desulfobaculum sp. SPO524]|uniref:cobalt-precorrin-5B (C(1))-methyltransferase n=1 Tax=Desulfobaculum sp. SPO524 TaxID=3378071 RepID=UPI00385199EB